MENSVETTNKKKPLVSVWMTAYFAEEYIGAAIESILMQKTDYPYEIVINDDCSGDGTWAVISAYAKKYPDIIRAKRNEENLGLSANVLDTKRRCRGKYIVNLSGDDYWIAEDKLQMQADFLESHPEYVGIGTRVELRYGDRQQAHASYPVAEALDRDYTLSDYENGILLPAHGFMMRNIFTDPDKAATIDRVYGLSATIDDLFDPLLYLMFGKIYISSRATCVYRVQLETAGRHNFNSAKPLKKTLAILEGYNAIAAGDFGVDMKRRLVGGYNLVLLAAIQAGKPGVALRAYKTIPESYRKPWKTSVGRACLSTVFASGLRQVKRRIKKTKVRREEKQ